MKYSKQMVSDVRKLKLKGYSNKKICEKLGFTQTTFYEWKNTIPEFSEMLEGTNKIISDELDTKLLQLANGMKVVEVTKELLKSKDGVESTKLVVTKKVTKEIPPDLNAIKYFKNNIDPVQWRERKEVSHTGEVDINHTIPASVKEILDEVRDYDTTGIQGLDSEGLEQG